MVRKEKREAHKPNQLPNELHAKLMSWSSSYISTIEGKTITAQLRIVLQKWRKRPRLHWERMSAAKWVWSFRLLAPAIDQVYLFFGKTVMRVCAAFYQIKTIQLADRIYAISSAQLYAQQKCLSLLFMNISVFRPIYQTKDFNAKIYAIACSCIYTEKHTQHKASLMFGGFYYMTMHEEMEEKRKKSHVHAMHSAISIHTNSRP